MVLSDPLSAHGGEVSPGRENNCYWYFLVPILSRIENLNVDQVNMGAFSNYRHFCTWYGGVCLFLRQFRLVHNVTLFYL